MPAKKYVCCGLCTAHMTLDGTKCLFVLDYQNSISWQPSSRNNRSKYDEKLCQLAPGHPELTSNKMAQIWNNLKLHNAKSICSWMVSAKSTKLTNVIFHSILFFFLLNWCYYQQVFNYLCNFTNQKIYSEQQQQQSNYAPVNRF